MTSNVNSFLRKFRIMSMSFIYLDRLSEDFNSSLCREEILHLVNADYKLILSLENTDIYKLN